MDNLDRLLLRPAEFAEMIGVSRSKAYELIANGTFPSVRVGQSVRVPTDAVREWINQQLVDRGHHTAQHHPTRLTSIEPLTTR